MYVRSSMYSNKITYKYSTHKSNFKLFSTLTNTNRNTDCFHICTLEFCTLEFCTLEFCTLESCTLESCTLGSVHWGSVYWGSVHWVLYTGVQYTGVLYTGFCRPGAVHRVQYTGLCTLGSVHWGFVYLVLYTETSVVVKQIMRTHKRDLNFRITHLKRSKLQ